MLRPFSIALLVLLAWTAPLATASDEPLAGLDEAIESARQQWHAPGLAVAIVKDDQVVYARGFGTKFIMQYQNTTPGLLTGLAEDLGKISVGTEMGWGRAAQAPGVSMSKQGVLTAAVKQGLLKGDLPPNRHYAASEQLLVDTSHPASNHLAPFEGHFEPCAALGQKVARGERLAWLHDFGRIDEAPLEVVSPHDGYVMTQAWGARVFAGQVISQVGRVVE